MFSLLILTFITETSLFSLRLTLLAVHLILNSLNPLFETKYSWYIFKTMIEILLSLNYPLVLDIGCQLRDCKSAAL